MKGSNHHVFVKLALFGEGVTKVSFEFLIVGNSTCAFAIWRGWWSDVLGHDEARVMAVVILMGDGCDRGIGSN